MRVALVHSYYSADAPSGENLAVELQAQALRNAGVEASIFGVSTDDLSHRRTYRIRTAWGVSTGSGHDPSAWLQAWKPDVVHVHNLFPNLGTSWIERWPGPMVATIHNYRALCAAGTLARDGADCFECVESRFPLPALRHRCYRDSLLATVPVALTLRGLQRNPVFRRADRIVFLADRAQRIFDSAGFRRTADVRLVPNFVERSDALPSEVDLPWIFVSRLSKEKGILPLLKVWPHSVPLHVYGDGPQRSEAEASAPDCVVVHGAISRDELLKILPRYRAMIFPSLFPEGLPTVYLESLAAGVPVLAHAGNSAADDIDRHGTGRTFAGFNEVPTAVRAVENAREALGTRAQARYEAAFSREAWTCQMLQLYDEIIPKPGDRA